MLNMPILDTANSLKTKKKNMYSIEYIKHVNIKLYGLIFHLLMDK